MTIDRRIDTGRTWRDLPPRPPEQSPERPVSPPEPPTPPAGPPRWPWILGAAMVLAAGVAVGIWAPWTAEDDSPPPAAADLPERIVPPPATTVPETTPLPAPEGPFGDSLDELRRFFEEQFPDGLPQVDPDQFSFQFDGLITIDPPPDGYRISSTNLQLAPDGLRQQIGLTGPEGEITVTGERVPGATAPTDGESVAVRGAEGKIVEGDGRITLTWLEAENLLVTIDAPIDFGRDAVLELAESLQVTP